MNRAVSVLLPLLFLVVLQITTITRNTELTSTYNYKSNQLILKPAGTFRELSITTLGRFLPLHFVAMSLLSLCTLVAYNSQGDLVPAGFQITSLSLLMILPILELNSYDRLLRGEIPESYIIYLFYFFLIVVLSMSSLRINDILSHNLLTMYVYIQVALVTFIIPLVCSIHFTHYLSDEL